VGRGLPGGTLEKLFRLGYDFHDEWDVSRAKFEAVPFGTLALICYALGRPMRERQSASLTCRSPVRP
jgi:hypothetical protein